MQHKIVDNICYNKFLLDDFLHKDHQGHLYLLYI